MPRLSQLEIIGPGGDATFHSLDPAKGVVNIGRHPENDIILDSPGVAPFHVVLDYRQRPCQIMLLSEEGEAVLRGETLAANVFQELHDWDTVEIDGYAIILLEGEAEPAVDEFAPAIPVPLPAPAEAPAAVPEPAVVAAPPLEPVGLPARPPDQTDEVVVVELDEREWSLDVEQTATCRLTIANGGDLVATFAVQVEGLDDSWVNISPPAINLYEGGRATVNITMTPPRLPTSTAGHHHLAVVVTSPNYPGRMSRLGATLTINPYYEFAVGELTPKQQTVSWRKRTGQATLPVTNKGNSRTPFRFDGDDDERACRFEFEVPGEEGRLIRQAEIRLPPGTDHELVAYITPIRRRLVALRKRSYSYTLTTTLVESAQMPRGVMGQIKAAPLIGPILLLLMFLCLAALIVILLRPARQPVLSVDNATPDSGETVTLTYKALRFPGWSSTNILNRLNGLFLGLQLYHMPQDGDWQRVRTDADFEDIVGEITETPPGTGRYQLRADTWLSSLIPGLQGVSSDVRVFLSPVEPEIFKFSADRTTVFAGDSVMLYWQVFDAETLQLEYNGIEETLEDDELEQGNRRYTVEQDTTFNLIAANSSWPQEKRRPLSIRVLIPTSTPPPTPVILRFDVDPLEITAGEAVRVSWEVDGADNVSIENLGNGLPLKGDVGDEPPSSTYYQLTAFKTAEDGTQVKNTSLLQEVIVNPEPSPTPEPETPVIEIFEATPKEVIAGEGWLVKLTWSVTGDTTDVQITAPNLELVGLESQDVVSVTVNETTLFILTAFNGDLKTSKAVEVKALEPTPTPEPTEPPPPPTPTPTPYPPPVIVYYKAEGLSPPADKVTFKSSSESGSGTVFEYDVQAGSMVKLSWRVDGADKVELQSFGPQPAEAVLTIPTPVIQAVTYMLTAENPGGTVSAFVKFNLVPRPAPPSPYNLRAEITPDPAIELTWYYDRAYIAEIDGFRVYRADVSPSGDGVFEPVHTMDREDDWQNRSKFSWVDDLQSVKPKGRTCGLAYYVVAFYWDVVANRERETDASTTSYYSPLCP